MAALVLFLLPLRCLPLWWLMWAWRRQEPNLHSWGLQLNIPSKGYEGNPSPQFQFQALCQGRVYPNEETSCHQWGQNLLNIPPKGHEGNPTPQFQVLCQGRVYSKCENIPIASGARTWDLGPPGLQYSTLTTWVQSTGLQLQHTKLLWIPG